MIPSPPTYAAPWADATRSSRARVAMRAVTRLDRLSDVLPPAAGAASPTDFAIVSGGHVLLLHRAGSSFFDASTGVRTSSSTASGDSAHGAFATRAGAFVTYTELQPNGTPTGRRLIDPLVAWPARIWAERVTDEGAWLVVQRPLSGNDATRRPRSIAVVLNRWAPDGTAQVVAGDRVEDASGVGAVFDDGEIVVATTDKRLIVYWPHDSPEHRMTLERRTDARLAFAPYDVAVVGDRIALLEAVGVALDPEGATGPYSMMEELTTSLERRRLDWTTAVHVLDKSGHALEHGAVRFAVLQPPIDGDHGRIYVAGLGFAALEHGKVVFAHASTLVCRATAFLDGDVAVTVGRELRFVGRDGAIKQSLRVPEGETITTPPAIAGDGAVFVVTEKALYAAR